MPWQDVQNLLVPLFFAGLLGLICFELGKGYERSKQASREEAIRWQAYRDGRKSVIDDQIKRLSMMAPELLRRMETGKCTTWESGYCPKLRTPKGEIK